LTLRTVSFRWCCFDDPPRGQLACSPSSTCPELRTAGAMSSPARSTRPLLIVQGDSPADESVRHFRFHG
jgi:hypothetical protein